MTAAAAAAESGSAEVQLLIAQMNREFETYRNEKIETEKYFSI